MTERYILLVGPESIPETHRTAPDAYIFSATPAQIEILREIVREPNAVRTVAEQVRLLNVTGEDALYNYYDTRASAERVDGPEDVVDELTEDEQVAECITARILKECEEAQQFRSQECQDPPESS